MPSGNDGLIDMVARRRGYLGIGAFSPAVIDVMRNLDRARFIPEEFLNPFIYEDEPVKIGHGQTCSQPSMVAAMATLLELEPGQRVLEIGSGCGYSAAVTAELVSPGGAVFSLEIVSELHKLSKENLAKDAVDRKKILFIEGDGSEGLAEHAPFDRIYLTAGVGRYFDETLLIEQLTDNGILLYPEAYGSMYLIRKVAGVKSRKEFHGVGFVLLRGKNSVFN